MQSIVVYPYSLLSVPFIRQLIYDKKYNIISVVMPSKWYEDGIDASFIDEGEPVGVSIFNDFEKQIENCTTILWVDYEYKQNDKFFDKVIDRMIYGIKENKNIICCQKLDSAILNKFINLSKEYNVKFDYLVNDINYVKQDKRQEKISVPIITVMGIGENCSKFETQLIIRRLLLDEGYKVSQIGSRQGCELLGFYSFPQFMFIKDYNEVEKIDNFYDFVIDIQNKENPDIIIIGIPGAIMPLNEKHSMNYGITAFEIFHAIKSDFNILNLWCDFYNDEFIEKISNVLEYKLHTLLDCVCMSNICIDNKSNISSILQYNVLKNNKVEEYRSKITNTEFYNITDSKSHYLLNKQIITQLSQ